jgi:hypothetical protein
MRMKSLVWICLISLFYIACTNEKNQARKFNDSLIIHQVRLMDQLNQINATILSGKRDSLQHQIDAAHAEVRKSIPEIKAIEVFPGGEKMKEKMVELFEFYDELFSNDYQEYIQLMQSDTAEESQLKTVLMQIQFRELQAVQLERELEDAQDSFTTSLGIRIVKDTAE